MRFFLTLVTAIVTVLVATTANAFCGFYVAKADTSLFNRASQVVLVRDEYRHDRRDECYEKSHGQAPLLSARECAVSHR